MEKYSTICHTSYDSGALHSMYDLIKGRTYLVNINQDKKGWVSYTICDSNTLEEISTNLRPMDLKRHLYTPEQMRDWKIEQILNE